MGDYSRDTYTLTNLLHEYLSGESVSDHRHYVAVRLQQDVPLLDADWNELDDIRRHEMEVLVRDFIGSGTPSGGRGFTIEQLEADNDFAIQPGMLLVDGWQVINPGVQRYSLQPRLEGSGSDLTAPTGNRTDLVYLDVHEQETTALGDERLVNPLIGVETGARRQRMWTVRVAEDVADPGALSVAEGHKIYPLARLRRSASPRILGHMIEDLRRTGLTLAERLKEPLYVRRGADELTPERYSAMLAALRSGLKTWQQNELFPIVLGGTGSWLGYQNAANEIYYLSNAAEINSDTRNLDNNDALRVLQKLVIAQHALMDVIERFGSGVPDEMAVINLYRAYLDGDSARSLNGIQPALDAGDLLAATEGQESLNGFLSTGTGELPEGSVTVMLAAVTPATAVTTDGFTVTYRVTSELLQPDSPEHFDLEVTVSDVRWDVSLSSTQLLLGPGESAEVQLTVDPEDSLNPGDAVDLNLTARVHRRPDIVSGQPAQRFTLGELPPGESFLFYDGAVDLSDGVLVLSRGDVEETFYAVAFALVNTSEGVEKHGFELSYELIWPDTPPDGVTPGDWVPDGPTVLPGVQEVPGSSVQANLSIRAPDLSAVTDDIEFTLRATATLIEVDDAPITDGKNTTVDLPIRILIS